MFKLISKNFAKSEKGSLSVEAVLVIPLLFWAVTATFVFFDAFKTLNISQKATYTVADMLSREENQFSMDYLHGLHEVFDFMSQTEGDNALRVSVVTLTEDPVTEVKTLEMVWSRGMGGVDKLETVDPIRDRIPTMGVGEQLIVVESEQEWSPSFAVGLTSYRFRETAIARPRYAPQLPEPSA